MLDRRNTQVLSYLRRTDSGDAVLVAMNFTAQPQTISLDLSGSGEAFSAVTTLLTDAPGLRHASSTQGLSLPPYATWIAKLH
jgi:alpha-glucosidase